MPEFLYEKYHPENAPYCSQFNKIKEDNFMTVYEMHKLTTKWLYQGYGDKTLFQAYDCNYACTGIGGKAKIKENCIEF